MSDQENPKRTPKHKIISSIEDRLNTPITIRTLLSTTFSGIKYLGFFFIARGVTNWLSKEHNTKAKSLNDFLGKIEENLKIVEAQAKHAKEPSQIRKKYLDLLNRVTEDIRLIKTIPKSSKFFYDKIDAYIVEAETINNEIVKLSGDPHLST